MTTTNHARLNHEFHNSLSMLNFVAMFPCTILSVTTEKTEYRTVHFDSTFFTQYFTTQWAGIRQLMQRGQLYLINVLQVASILSVFILSMDLSFNGELLERRGKRASITESFVN